MIINVIGADVLQEMRADVPLAQKEDYFRQMLRQDADLEGISRFVLGPYWRIASAEQRQEFENLLRITSFARTDPCWYNIAAAHSG